MESIDKLEKLLRDTNLDYPTESIFDIGGFGNIEKIINKFYKFYFGNKNVHGLGTIFIDSLVSVANKKGVKIPKLWKNYSVRREVATKRQKRIDILIEEGHRKENQAIIIEIKIDANLNNDFEEYYNFVKAPEGKKFGILLHDKPIKEECKPFFKITHAELLREVRERIYKANAKNFYAIFALLMAERFDKTPENIKKQRVADEFSRNKSNEISELGSAETNLADISPDLVFKANKMIDYHQSMVDRLFGGLKNSYFLLNLKEATCRRLIGGELALKFKIHNWDFRLIFFINGNNSSGVISVYLDLLESTKISTKQYYSLTDFIEKMKFPKEHIKRRIVPKKNYENLYFTMAQKNYQEKDLSDFGETADMLLNLVKNDWLPLIKHIEKDINKLKIK